MERSLNTIINDEPSYSTPYVNHSGCGSAIGSGNRFGQGFGNVKYTPKESYTGKDIISFNGNKTYFLDDYVLYIKHFRFPWIKGEIIKNDFTTQPCYLSSINNKIAISDSIKSVYDELKEKIDKKKYNENDIARAFVLCHPEYDKKYQWFEMVEWHALNLNSCIEGRNAFTDVCGKNKYDMSTPKELIELMFKHNVAIPLAEKLKKLYLQ